jgi:hypothetical protein
VEVRVLSGASKNPAAAGFFIFCLWQLSRKLMGVITAVITKGCWPAARTPGVASHRGEMEPASLGDVAVRRASPGCRQSRLAPKFEREGLSRPSRTAFELSSPDDDPQPIHGTARRPKLDGNPARPLSAKGWAGRERYLNPDVIASIKRLREALASQTVSHLMS